METETVYVVINSEGNIFGLYDVFEDAWDRVNELQEDHGIEVDVEEYILNQDVEHYDTDDSPNVVDFA